MLSFCLPLYYWIVCVCVYIYTFVCTTWEGRKLGTVIVLIGFGKYLLGFLGRQRDRKQVQCSNCARKHRKTGAICSRHRGAQQRKPALYYTILFLKKYIEQVLIRLSLIMVTLSYILEYHWNKLNVNSIPKHKLVPPKYCHQCPFINLLLFMLC